MKKQSTKTLAGRSLLLGKTLALAALLSLAGCAKEDTPTPDTGLELAPAGVFVLNEGNFEYGNGTLSFYDPLSKQVENEVFFQANDMRLGDGVQSMSVHNGVGWVVVTNSRVVFAIDLDTAREKGRITGLTAPRYMHFVSDRKAYITQLYDNRIFVVDPQTYQVTGHIDCSAIMDDMATGSTEQMVQDGRYLYVTCWSYQNCMLKIDTQTDQIVDQLEIGVQPASLAMDKNHKLWTMTDGGYDGNPIGYEAPSICRIDPETFTVEQRFTLALGDYPSELQLDGDGDTLYWINKDIWRMGVDAVALPAQPFIDGGATWFYGLTIDPVGGEIYAADAVDYQQQGLVYHYSATGEPIDEFYVGIIPGAFCWKR